jgi:transcriptional regulator with XRE-family HTH domain
MPYTDQECTILARVGAAIREKRKSKGLSQEALAFEARLDRTYVGSVERGERNISVLNLVRIAEALDTTVASLVEILK